MTGKMGVYLDPWPRFRKRYIVNHENGCWEWQTSLDNKGYGSSCYRGRKILAHRLSWILHRGPLGELQVLHKCDNPCCVNPNHLFLGTAVDNMADMTRKGRRGYVFGEKQHLAKLTEEDVRKIRQTRGTNAEIAQRYNVTPSLISQIRVRRIWKHVP